MLNSKCESSIGKRFLGCLPKFHIHGLLSMELQEDCKIHGLLPLELQKCFNIRGLLPLELKDVSRNKRVAIS